MPRLAIVIWSVGRVESLEGTLVSVLENRPADCEIIVALARPYDDPYDLAGEVRFLPPESSEQPLAALNRALAVSRAPFVHLLTSGCLVSEGWADAALARFGDRQVGSVAPIVWDGERSDHILAAGVGYRRHGRRYLVGSGEAALDPRAKQSIIGPCSLAGFYRKAALELVGGFSTRLGPLQADADLALMLKQAGFTVAIEGNSRLRASATIEPCLPGFRESLYSERLFRRNFYDASLGKRLAHWGSVALDVLGSFPRPRMLAMAAGRLLGSCEFGYARHQRALAELAARSRRPTGQGASVRIDGQHHSPQRREQPQRRGVGQR